MRDKQYILDILDACDKVANYIDGYSFESFVRDPKCMDACMRNLQVIGEASKKLSIEYKNKNTQVDWVSIVGMRNIVVHEYSDIDPEIVWATVTDDLPRLYVDLALAR